jgi:hypothetical protein
MRKTRKKVWSKSTGYIAAINEYLGRNTSNRPSTTRTSVSFSGGTMTNRMHASVRAITSARSMGVRSVRFFEIAMVVWSIAFVNMANL